MRTIRLSWLTLAATALALSGLVAVAVWPTTPIKNKIDATIAAKERSFDLAKLTDFEWAEVYLFREGATREQICARLGIKGLRCRLVASAPPGKDDVLLAFMRDGELVHHEMWNTYSFAGATFTTLRAPERVSSQDANFTVDWRDSDMSLDHRPRSSNALLTDASASPLRAQRGAAKRGR